MFGQFSPEFSAMKYFGHIFLELPLVLPGDAKSGIYCDISAMRALSCTAHCVLGSGSPLLICFALQPLNDFVLKGYPADKQLSLWCLTALAGVALGRVVRAIFPDSAATGQAAAILPIGIWLFLALLGIALNPAGMGGLFDYSGGPVSIDEGWLLDLITLLTWSCCWYSLGMRTGKAES